MQITAGWQESSFLWLDAVSKERGLTLCLLTLKMEIILEAAFPDLQKFKDIYFYHMNLNLYYSVH